MSLQGGGPGYGYPPGMPGFRLARVNWNWIGESWDIFCRAPGAWIFGTFVYLAVMTAIRLIVPAFFPSTTPVQTGPGILSSPLYQFMLKLDPAPAGVPVLYVLNWLIGSFFTASLYHMAVKQTRGEGVSWSDIFDGARFYGHMIVFTILSGLLNLAGILLLCFGVFVSSAFLLPAPALVGDGTGAVLALSRSFSAVKDDWLNASLFVFVWALVVVMSAIPCGLGLFVTLPMQFIISALAYRDMVGMPTAGSVGFVPQVQPGTWPPPPGQQMPYPSAPYLQPDAYGQYPPPPGQHPTSAYPPADQYPAGAYPPPPGQYPPGGYAPPPGQYPATAYPPPSAYPPAGQFQEPSPPQQAVPPQFGGTPQSDPSQFPGPGANTPLSGTGNAGEEKAEFSPFGQPPPAPLPRPNLSGWHGRPGETWIAGAPVPPDSKSEDSGPNGEPV